MKKVALFSSRPQNIQAVYDSDRRKAIAGHYDLLNEIITPENIEQYRDVLPELEYIFSTWGMFVPDEKYLSSMTRLKAVLYAAGSVKGFAEPFLRRGIQVVTAARANGEFVADLAASQIQLAARGYFHNFRVGGYNSGDTRSMGPIPGLFETRIGLIASGFVGREVIARLRPLRGVEIAVYDPYLSDAAARELGVVKCSLDTLFATSQVVSNHAPITDETVGMVRYSHFASMRPCAAFINTGRGITVVEEDLIRALKERPDLVALLDVTWPEPPEAGSPLYQMPNVFYTRHIAGAHAHEVCHMADFCLECALKLDEGVILPDSVTLERLKTMA